MAAKSFKGGLDSILGGESKVAKKRGRPRVNVHPIEKTSEIGVKEHEIRATFIVDKEKLEKLKALAHYDRSTIKELFDNVVDIFLNSRSKDVKLAIETFKKKKKKKI